MVLLRSVVVAAIRIVDGDEENGNNEERSYQRAGKQHPAKAVAMRRRSS
jgi:hypothetical protein